jgi:hypothetical protein
MIVPSPNNKSLKHAAMLSLFAFGILLIGSIIFYRERMLFIDPAYVSFRILNIGGLQTGLRYGSFITHMVPLFFHYFHMPLKIVLLAYSLSFYVFYSTVAALLVFRYKKYGLAILLCFYFLLFVSDGYYWPNNEVHQGIAWMFLFLGIFLNKKKGEKELSFKNLLLAAIVFLAFSSHMLVVISFSFLWLYFWIDGKNRHAVSFKKMVIYSTVIIAIFLVKYINGLSDVYDQAKLQNINQISFERILATFSSGQAKSFFDLLLTNYWVVLPIFLTGIWLLIQKRQYIHLILTLVFCLIYFMLICVTYPGAFGTGTQFYMESEWQGLAILVSTPFVYLFLRNIKPFAAILFVGLILMVRLIYMGYAAPKFEQRLVLSQQVLAAMKAHHIHKLILIRTPELEQQLIMTWGAPIESLYLSVLQKDSINYTFKIMAAEDTMNVPHTNTAFLECFSVMENKELNPFYFTPDSSQTYEIMTYRELTGK